MYKIYTDIKIRLCGCPVPWAVGEVDHANLWTGPHKSLCQIF